MRLSYRQLFLVTVLTAAALVAGARLAHAQSISNPSFLEFSSADHASVGTYRICFYQSATATTALRCNDVPVAAAVSQGNGVYRIPRAAWVNGLSNNTDYWPRVIAVGTSGSASAEVAPTVAPFSFKLAPAPRDVTGVILGP